jgi:arylsulfatase A-like enzyme
MQFSRRQLLQLSGMGFGALALSCLEQQETALGKDKAIGLAPREPHMPARAKSVILMMQNGGPSQMELFDPKPMLKKYNGKPHSIKVEMFQKGSEGNVLLDSPFSFKPQGECGTPMSDVIPHIGSMADDLCVVRSMHTGHNNHTEGLIMFMTGKVFQGRPSFGSWISYGLGTENRNLPAYVVLRDPKGYNTSGTLTWSSGFLPSLYGGTEFSSQGAPVLNLSPAQEQVAGVQAENLRLLAQLNRRHQRRYPRESDLETRIQNYELAARMQLEASELLDISKETEETNKLYGLDNATTRPYGVRCLLARKLVEAGVRFVQVHPKPTQPWDTHSNTKSSLAGICGETDLPTAGLIKDLKQRGLLDETIVIWSGEFGRLPVSQNGTGRDHNRNAFSLLLAGGGFKPGITYGETDEVGYKAAVNRVSMADLHATVLHQLGLDHEQLIYHQQGRDETLTDSSLTEADVVRDILA